MKVFLSLTLLAAVAFAEPPLYRQQQQQQQRYYFARQQEETTASSGPYAPRGWRPAGPAFNLPQRQQQQQLPQVDNAYGPPAQEPQQQYGPPPQAPQQQYGAAPEAGPSPRQQVPAPVKQQQFARQQQQQQYGAPEPQEQQYGAAAAKQQQFRGFAKQQQQQQQPQEQYGAPEPQEQQYGAVAAKQQQFRGFAKQQRQQQPAQQYGAPQPQEQYGAPQSQYPTSTEVPNATEIDEPVTENSLNESEAEQLSEFDEEREPQADSRQQQQQQERGEYYVALPDGRLQRVRYVSRQDLEAMRYFAKIRAENVEPLRGPIYAYAPLQKLQVAPGQLEVAVAPAGSGSPSLTVSAEESRPQKLVQPKIDIKPLAQLQIQHDDPAAVVPLSTSYATYTANYAAPAEQRYILAFP